MNNVIDEVLDLSSTGGAIKYTIAPDGQDSFLAQIDLATNVTTQGTPLNKVLFDSIKADLNTRLLISSKSTQAQAEAGTNNTQYMTPLRTAQAIFAQRKVRTYDLSLTAGQWNDIVFADYMNTNTKKIIIEGTATPSYDMTLTTTGGTTQVIGTAPAKNAIKLEFLFAGEEVQTKIEVATSSSAAPNMIPLGTNVMDFRHFTKFSVYPRTRKLCYIS